MAGSFSSFLFLAFFWQLNSQKLATDNLSAEILRFASIIDHKRGAEIEIEDTLITTPKTVKTKHPYFKEVEYKKSGATKKKKHYEDQVKNNTQIDGITIKQTPQTGIVSRSCHEYRLSGIKKSGFYEIDPDGYQNGLPPIQAYCKFGQNSSETIIKHKLSDYVIMVDHCNKPGCFEQKIQYDDDDPAGSEKNRSSKSLKQIISLIQISGQCRQFVTFSCFDAPLRKDPKPRLGWWTDRTGSERYFWSGKNINSNSCHCGRNNTCLDPEKPCNCDANVPEILSDKGFITAKEILPIRSVVYGPLSYKSQNANFTVGPLICTGQFKLNPEEINCNSLKLSGIFKSSVQILRTNKTIRMSYCDMSREGYEGPIELKLMKLA